MENIYVLNGTSILVRENPFRVIGRLVFEQNTIKSIPLYWKDYLDICSKNINYKYEKLSESDVSKIKNVNYRINKNNK
jgi:hypothetical protein